jgi:ribosomal protein L9
VVKKTTKEKYNELKQQYDDLAEKYCLALAAAQASNNQLEPKVITLTAQKKGIGSSLSSLSSNTISSINASTLH